MSQDTTTEYAENITQQSQRERTFVYHPPHGDQTVRYQQIRDTANTLSHIMNRRCPPGRELSTAQTKLQEAVMWANAAIACNE